MNLQRLFAVVRKELMQLRRDKLSFGMILAVPTFELLLFGFAINLDVRHLQAAVLDEANSGHSRELVAELRSSQVLDLDRRLLSPQQVPTLLRSGAISAAVIIPPDFEERFERGDRSAWQIVVDGSDQSVQAAVRQLAAFPLADLGGRPGRTASGVELVNLYNPERIAAVNTVPGYVGVVLTMTMVLYTSMALVREREHGNLEMLIATPLTPVEMLLGKTLPFVAIGLVQVTLILVLGQLVFHVPVRGSPLAVYGASLVFILASLSLGVIISTLAQTQFQAMQMTLSSFLPQLLLSGFMFPFDGMPRPAQWFAELLPLTHFVRLMRGIMLRSAGLDDLLPDLAILAVFGLLLFGIAVLRTRKQLP